MKFAELLCVAAGLQSLCQALVAGQHTPANARTFIPPPGSRCNVSRAPAVYDFVLASSSATKQPLWNHYTGKSEVSKQKEMLYGVPIEPTWNHYTDAGPAGKRTELESAMQEYQLQGSKLQAAEARLQNAMEALLQVPSVDGLALSKLLSAKQNTVVVFYAPWCQQCQKFVLSDGSGNPSMAPLEIFRRRLTWDEEAKRISVVRFDVEKNGDSYPPVFHVLGVGIPAIYFIDSTGTVTPYLEDPHHVVKLQRFVLAHAK